MRDEAAWVRLLRDLSDGIRFGGTLSVVLMSGIRGYIHVRGKLWTGYLGGMVHPLVQKVENPRPPAG